LNLPPEERVVYDTILKNPLVTSITGKRSDEQLGLRLDQNLRPMKGNAPVPLSDFFAKAAVLEGEENVQEGAKDVKTVVIPVVSILVVERITVVD
jgi:Fanconi-associated nuclease 1